jgi:hypothetical protein
MPSRSTASTTTSRSARQPASTASTFTLETWFRWTGGGAGTSTGSGGIANAIPLVTKGRAEQETPATVNMDYFLGIDAATGVLVGDFEDSADGTNHPVSGTAVVTANAWHHAAATYDGTTWRLYLDGVLDRSLVVARSAPRRRASSTPRSARPSPRPASRRVLRRHDRRGPHLGHRPERQPDPCQPGRRDRRPDRRAPRPVGPRRGRRDERRQQRRAINGTLTGGPAWVTGYGFRRTRSPRPSRPA